ncbi:hypothetical protein HOLleu_20634 [Holothuria leucospilota]|uniref:CEP152 CEP63 binding coiled coil domain-containing protein n=1 Tax=Holothuria leucospilota TaxID=206669 RepID=A0A9Q1H5U4_HOLLE|nr:hypothetical protein HOLleu_20634 [Holothuria leucospilota]
MNVGSSINFDGKAFVDQQEEELEREEQHREQKLRELLSNALPDDLLEEDSDVSSLSSQDEHEEETEPDRPIAWKSRKQESQKTSTPQGRSPPPLKTPATATGARVKRNDKESNLVQGNSPPEVDHQTKNHKPSCSPLSSDSPTDQQYETGRREAEGSDYMTDQPHFSSPRTTIGYTPHIYYPNEGHYQGGLRQDIPAHHRKEGSGGIVWDMDTPDDRRQSQQYETPERKGGGGPYPVGKLVDNHVPPTEVHVYPVHSENNHPQITPKVQYKRGGDDVDLREDTETRHAENQGERCPALGRAASVDLLLSQQLEALQGHYLHPGGTSSNQQLTQMQILYQARGRELEQLTGQLRILQEESAREKRILNHQLALAQGEKDGLATSYEQTKHLLVSAKEENLQLQGNLQAANAQIQATLAAKEEIVQKLHTSEATIETLTKELTELQKAQPLARVREHQDTVLAEMQRRHQEEVADLQERLQRLISELDEKESHAGRLQQNFDESQRSLQQYQIQHAETLNRLTAQLEESQRQCRDLLGQGSYQEIKNLHQQLQTVEHAKQMSEGLCKTLQDEVKDLKQQLQALESAVRLGALSSQSPPEGKGDSVVRNLAKEDWNTPKTSTRSLDAQSSDQVIEGLKTELTRSLINNKNKRNQVAKLQEEIETLKGEVEKWRNKAQQAENELQEGVAATSPDKAVPEESERLQATVRNLTSELEKCKELENRLNEENTELKRQMAEMISDNDEDKRIALERCQNTCMQLHEDSSRNLREELVAQWKTEKAALKESHEKEITQLKAEHEKTIQELDEVKQHYIKVCEEKNGIEDQLKEKIRGDFNKKSIEVKEKCDADKEVALEDLRLSLENIHKAKLIAARAEKDAEVEEMLKKKVEIARHEWVNNDGKQIAHDAVKKCNREWEVKVEREVENRLHQINNVDAAHFSVSVQTDGSVEEESKELVEGYKAEVVKLQAELRKHAEEIKAREALFEEKLNNLRQKHEKQLDEEFQRHERNLEEKLTQARTMWEGMQQHKESKHAQHLDALTEQWIQEKKQLEKKHEMELKQRIDEAVKDSETIMRKMVNAEVTGVKEEVMNKERNWIREKESLQEQLRNAEDELKYARSKVNRLVEDGNEGLEQQVSELRGKLCRVEQEKKQLEHKFNRDLNYMKTRMKEANALTSESLETRLSDLQRSKHRSSSLKSMSDDARHSGSGTDVEEASVQTVSQQDSHADCLQELRNQYLNTVAQIRVDVMQHVAEVREHCQQTVRMEVEKARNSTAKRLREHFTLCLKNQLEEDKKRARNDKRRQSATFMLSALNRFMETKLNDEVSENTETDRDVIDQLQGSAGDTQGVSSSQEQDQRGKGRSRINSVHFDSDLPSNGNFNSTQERNKSHLTAGLLANLPAEDDEDLLQRTFDRLSVLDGSSDSDSVMRSNSPVGDFHSLEEVSLSASQSSVELEQILQRNDRRMMMKNQHSSSGNWSSVPLSNVKESSRTTSRYEHISTERRAPKDGNVTTRQHSSRSSGRNAQSRTKSQSDMLNRSIGKESKGDGRHRRQSDLQSSDHFVPLTHSDRSENMSKSQRCIEFDDLTRPVPLVTRQTQTAKPKSSVNLSAASVTTEYNDLPDNIRH